MRQIYKAGPIGQYPKAIWPEHLFFVGLRFPELVKAAHTTHNIQLLLYRVICQIELFVYRTVRLTELVVYRVKPKNPIYCHKYAYIITMSVPLNMPKPIQSIMISILLPSQYHTISILDCPFDVCHMIPHDVGGVGCGLVQH